MTWCGIFWQILGETDIIPGVFTEYIDDEKRSRRPIATLSSISEWLCSRCRWSEYFLVAPHGRRTRVSLDPFCFEITNIGE
jgi:hypothetical protein